ncbi:hypothetical protein RHIZ404_230376 [Rhizobium sp. EC-SD404]|nr:hypothetical protein RHIZ404_230376 [Rhizobium sp. EC-SD404]
MSFEPAGPFFEWSSAGLHFSAGGASQAPACPVYPARQEVGAGDERPVMGQDCRMLASALRRSSFPDTKPPVVLPVARR